MKIEYDAFRGCTGQTSFTIPESIASIGPSVFSGSTGLALISFPEKNTYLCCGVFLYYSGLVSVVVPKTLCYIIENPFMGCENLLSIEVSEQNYNITSITEFCSARTGKSCSVLQQGEVWEVFYPVWCGVICANLFCGCSKLESV